MNIEIDTERLENKITLNVLRHLKAIIDSEVKGLTELVQFEPKPIPIEKKKPIKTIVFNEDKKTGRNRLPKNKDNINFILSIVDNTKKKFTKDDFINIINPDMNKEEQRNIGRLISELVKEGKLREAGVHPDTKDPVFCNPDY